MNDECLICSSPLEYLTEDIMMECEICGRKELSKTRCIKGHYVCSECHTKGLDAIVSLCLNETSKDPFLILNKMMNMDFCHMHGPEHHVLVGSALLTAYKNAGGEIELESGLYEIIRRGKQVPGGSCGFCGSCGAGVSAGIFIAVATESTPLSAEPFGLANRMTASALNAIGEIGGPRCCKRDSYLSITKAIEFVKENLSIEMDRTEIICEFSKYNNQCIGKRCPFSKINHTEGVSENEIRIG